MPDVDDELETIIGDGDGGNTNFVELRKYAKRVAKEAAEKEKQLAELSEFRDKVLAEQRETAVGKAFEDAKLAPEHAKLFKAVNPDLQEVTKDDVLKFAGEYKLPTIEGEAAETPEPDNTTPGFQPKTGGDAPVAGKLDSAAVMEMLRQGRQDEVAKAAKEGRLQKEAAPWTQ